MKTSYSLMVHGGAGDLDAAQDRQLADSYRAGIRQALDQGRAILAGGGCALDAVEACAALLEDDPAFNAGRGSVLNEDGRVEMDAGIMDGRDLSAGAVAAVSGIANPVRLARLVMVHSGHVLLSGEGARRFAEQIGVPRVPDHYLLTPERVSELERLRKDAPTRPIQRGGDSRGKWGTIGAVARDLAGNLAAATSTGGIVNKRVGRVGDSPLIGAGLYADNESCAVSATGRGEDLMRTAIAKTVADIIEHKGVDAQSAVLRAMEYLQAKVAGRGGVIVIDRQGRCAAGWTTKGMIHGWIEHGAEAVCRL
jgi:beta-aspartyl-peptidase (threonine type)